MAPIFPLGILSSASSNVARFQPPSRGNARLPRAHYVDCTVCSSARCPQLIMEKPWNGGTHWQNRYLRDIFPVRGKGLSIPVHIRQDIHGIVLEHFATVPSGMACQRLARETTPSQMLDTMNTHLSATNLVLVPDYLCRKRLHHLNGVCPIPSPICSPLQLQIVLGQKTPHSFYSESRPCIPRYRQFYGARLNRDSAWQFRLPAGRRT